ncbi:MAG: peroxiredoxin-like family protein [Porphyromonadaceae bacterium]|nr:peroxiredoxin-like family protein [Porphyromonadaceae bacterium]
MKILKIVLAASFLYVAALNAQDASKALKVGDKAKDFTLKNAQGNPVRLYTLLKKGNVVLTWYRGGWCPYCNLALKQLQDALPEIKAQDAHLVALTPELPDSSLSTKEKHQLQFEILTDLNNDVARTYGLVFKLDETTATRYEQGFQLSAYNGNHSAELPMPATYVIDKKGIIRYAFVEADYKHRADPNVIVAELKKIKAKN